MPLLLHPLRNVKGFCPVRTEVLDRETVEKSLVGRYLLQQSFQKACALRVGLPYPLQVCRGRGIDNELEDDRHDNKLVIKGQSTVIT